MEKKADHIAVSKFPPGPMLGLFEVKEDKRLPVRKFLFVTIIGLVSLIALTLAVHVSVDIYGLFLPAKGRTIKVYHDERIAKYLLMHHYVPENYNGLLIGTSLSDNLNVSTYNERENKFHFYNGSIMGANISEVKTLAEKAIDGGIRNVIFCVSPYQFKNTGAKEIELNNKLYYGAFGSWNLYETYAVALIRKYNLMPQKFPTEHINGDGVNNFTARYRAIDVSERIRQVADVHRGKDFPMDSIAVAEFKTLIKNFRKQDIHFLIYFHPVPKDLYRAQEAGYAKFEKIVRDAVSDQAKIIDLNDGRWDSFTQDNSNYIDNGHLSEQGQESVVKEVMGAFERRYR
jgi:hypothetical protein